MPERKGPHGLSWNFYKKYSQSQLDQIWIYCRFNNIIMFKKTYWNEKEDLALMSLMNETGCSEVSKTVVELFRAQGFNKTHLQCKDRLA